MLELVARVVVVLLVAPILLIGAAGLLLLMASALPRAPRRVRETFTCPQTKRVVTADFLVFEWAQHPSDVVTCTRFPDPERITCKKACREFADAQWGLSRGIFPRWALIADGVTTWREAEERARAA
ncbi:MAG TPA: hypothetical protein VJO34_16030 [Methylomirabilota bacterium]|nr:hypothetical protein [Methylomirabilota bacterium]